MLKQNRGYSLIEIGVGILILTVFLLFSLGLFNGCYNNYRGIKARNLAMDRAIYHVEQMLQTDSDELAGYFVRDNKNSLIPNPYFEEYIHDNFTSFRSKYASYKGISVDDIVTPPAVGSDDMKGFIKAYSETLINSYIYNEAHSEATQDQLDRGTYGFLDEDGKVDEMTIVLDNENAFGYSDSNDYIASNNGALKVVKQVTRIPAVGGKAYGNNVLVLRVTVYYTKEFKRNMPENEMDSIVIETVKVK